MGMDDEILDISNMLLALHGRREDNLQRHSRPDARLPHHCILVKAMPTFSVLNQLQLVGKSMVKDTIFWSVVAVLVRAPF